MPSPTRKLRPASLLALSAALGMSLSGCRLEDAMAIAGASGQIPYAALPASSAALPYGYAPDVYDLPYAPPAPIGRLDSYDDGYAWAERAYAADYAFHQAPPDYGFWYEGVQPWVWRTAANWLTFAEPFDDGYRTYYYEPEADYPYFVRDAEYGYGYDPYGRLVTLYDPYGRMLPASHLYDRADEAGLYWARARALREAAEREQRMRVAEALWFARRETLARQQQGWIQAATTYDPWVAYRARTDERELRLFQDERLRREREIDRWERRQAALQRAAYERRDDGSRWSLLNFGRQRSAEQHAINAERQAQRRAERELRVAERDQARDLRQVERGRRQAVLEERRQESLAEARPERRERMVERQARRAEVQERRAAEVRTEQRRERLAERQARQERVRAVREQSGREQARVQRAAERAQVQQERQARREQVRAQAQARPDRTPQREMRAYQPRGGEAQEQRRQQRAERQKQRQQQPQQPTDNGGGDDKGGNGKGGGKNKD